MQCGLFLTSGSPKALWIAPEPWIAYEPRITYGLLYGKLLLAYDPHHGRAGPTGRAEEVVHQGSDWGHIIRTVIEASPYNIYYYLNFCDKLMRFECTSACGCYTLSYTQYHIHTSM
eukprot:g528.t1